LRERPGAGQRAEEVGGVLADEPSCARFGSTAIRQTRSIARPPSEVWPWRTAATSSTGPRTLIRRPRDWYRTSHRFGAADSSRVRPGADDRRDHSRHRRYRGTADPTAAAHHRHPVEASQWRPPRDRDGRDLPQPIMCSVQCLPAVDEVVRRMWSWTDGIMILSWLEVRAVRER
jgi:hypothetical protein